ncbi:MAG: TonB-dependent receptor [Ignavibacteriae bacterium]|nr:TonB-dependent receptor [Ignavibacteriota bacterium]
MRKLNTFSIIMFLSMLIYSVTFAQSGAGKLAGKITDAATGEPLIGANVILINTSQGSAADINGEYFILNITPGTYQVKISFVGYQTQTFTDVRVVAGITYELNAALSSGLNLEEIVVTSDKFFEEKSTNTVKVIDSDEIARLPVKGVARHASLQSGVVMQDGSGGADGNATINVRGGRGAEVLYIVDGIPQNDAFTGTNYSQVSDAAIEQISFQIGGYEAKYGQAQSGIINVTTKSGNPKYNVYADLQSSEFTDDYGYNLYTATLSGPIIPGDGSNTFFLSAERGYFADADPSAEGVKFESIGYSSKALPNNESDLWRFSGRTKHYLGDFTLSLGANLNFRNYRGYVHSYTKNNSEHNTRNEQYNHSYSLKVSQNVDKNSFWNLTAGYRQNFDETGDGVWFDDLEAYGDVEKNRAIGVELPNGEGSRVTFDEYGMFAAHGRVWNTYDKFKTQTMNADLDFTSQVDNHLLEIGGGFAYNTVRNYVLGGVTTLASTNVRDLPDEEKYANLRPEYYGYSVTGVEEEGEGFNAAKHPLSFYGYVQDRFELEDLVINLGVRVDYFDADTDVLKDPKLPYAYGDPSNYDAADFVAKESEFYISPRIGLGFPVTESTVFHAQYGVFIQQPSLDQIFEGYEVLRNLITDNSQTVQNGYAESEKTTQYEIGFRQVLGDVAALNLTAFYKNTLGLVNVQTVKFQRVEGGELLEYYAPSNSDFGTIKGLAFSVDISRIKYFNLGVDYTYSVAEGTGSSTNSSFVASFRNDDNDIPKVIAPLDFDQRHTGIVNLGFFVPKGELGLLEMFSADVLMSFSSGRPYTPLFQQNLISGNTNYGDTRGYVNSAYGPGNFRIDLKVEKSFEFAGLRLSPYLWVENLLDAVNEITVYRTTGNAYTTDFLNTDEAKLLIAQNGEGWAQDYRSLELDPANFGIPRLIKLGIKLNFDNF